jgi:hypothetical protein
VTDDQLGRIDEAEDVSTGTDVYDEEPPQYGVGPFSVREVALVVVWAIAFVVSFFSVTTLGFESVWTSGLLWILTIAIPSVAVFLVVLRRLSPEGIRRVGSLGIDQFASVAFSVSAVLWLQLIWETVAIAADGGPWVRSWVIWVEFVLMLAGVALTVFAPFIPPFEQDFRGRPEAVAHRNARPIRPVSPRPAVERRPRDEAPQTAADQSVLGAESTGEADAVVWAEPAEAERSNAERSNAEPAYAEPAYAEPTYVEPTYVEPEPTVEATPEPTAETTAIPRHQAFWALVPEERDIVDELGIPLFRIGPTAWALVIEDRGDTFVVRHEDGRVGYLRDVSGVTRG